jgi:hypothetical protein
VVFGGGPLLQQHIALAVEYKNAESPVQQGFAVGFHFFHGTNRFVAAIDENYFFLHVKRWWQAACRYIMLS